MAHGAPDNFDVQAKPTTFKLSDMAELAERLGAIPSLDRLGDVIFADDFKDGLVHWNTEVLGVGTTIVESGVWSMHGGWSVKVNLPADASAYARIYRSLPYPVSSRIGFEFNATSDTNLNALIGYLTFYTGAYKITFALKFDIPGGKVYYLNALGVWTLIASNVYMYYAGGLFHRGKFIVDLPNLKYLRYSISTGTVSMADLAPFITADTTLAHMYVELYVTGNVSGAIEVYLDSFIITQNEP